MANFKNIRIKMKGGKSRMQRVKVLASGKFKFVKNLIKRRTSRTRKANPTRRKGVRSMTRRRKKRRGGKSFTQTAFKWIRIGALAAPAVNDLMTQDSWENKARMLIQHYTGYDTVTRTWNWNDLIGGYAPYFGAVLATVGIPKLAAILRRL